MAAFPSPTSLFSDETFDTFSPLRPFSPSDTARGSDGLRNSATDLFFAMDQEDAHSRNTTTSDSFTPLLKTPTASRAARTLPAPTKDGRSAVRLVTMQELSANVPALVVSEDPDGASFESFGGTFGEMVRSSVEAGKESSYLIWAFNNLVGVGAYATVASADQFLSEEGDFSEQVAIKFYRQIADSPLLEQQTVEREHLQWINDRILVPRFSPNFAEPYYTAVVDRRTLRNTPFRDSIPEFSVAGRYQLPVMVSEFADSGTLDETTLAPDAYDARSVAAQLLFALEAMQRNGMHHRDIRGQNIVLSRTRSQGSQIAFSLRKGERRNGDFVYFIGDFTRVMPLILDLGLANTEPRASRPGVYKNAAPERLDTVVTALFSRAPELLINYESMAPQQRRTSRFFPIYTNSSELFSMGIALLSYVFGTTPMRLIRTLNNEDKEFEDKALRVHDSIASSIRVQCKREKEFAEKNKEIDLLSHFESYVCDQDTKGDIAEYLIGMVLLQGFPHASALIYRDANAPLIFTLTPIGKVLFENKRKLANLFSEQPAIFEKGLLGVLEDTGSFPDGWEGLPQGGRARDFRFDSIPLLRKMTNWNPGLRSSAQRLLVHHPYFSLLRTDRAPMDVILYGEEVAKRNAVKSNMRGQAGAAESRKELVRQVERLGVRDRETQKHVFEVGKKRTDPMSGSITVDSRKKPRVEVV